MTRDPKDAEQQAATTLVVGMVETPFERDQEANIITLAAAAIAATAAIGNQDPSTLNRILTNAVHTLESLSPAAGANLYVIADEIVAAAKAGKRFMALARFRED